MENQHRKIAGYRELSQEEIDLINEIKEQGKQLGALYDKLATYLSGQELKAVQGLCYLENEEEYDRLEKAEPQFWMLRGKASLQTGLMQITRAIAQPETF